MNFNTIDEKGDFSLEKRKIRWKCTKKVGSYILKLNKSLKGEIL